MKWLRYRFKFSSGPGEWEYEPLYWNDFDGNDERACDNVIQIIEEKERYMGYNEGEHYRGFNWEVIDSKDIPRDIFVKEYNKLTGSFELFRSRLRMFKKEMEQIK